MRPPAAAGSVAGYRGGTEPSVSIDRHSARLDATPSSRRIEPRTSAWPATCRGDEVACNGFRAGLPALVVRRLTLRAALAESQ
jgi:hypothetical protein